MIENSAGWRYVQSTDSPADYPTVSAHNAGKFQDLKSIVGGLDTELDGKAPLSHTHSTSQVTGLDAALQGKAPLSTLNTRVPDGLALRLATTVGTRIFAGNTMIYGELPWISISALLTSGWSGEIYARRDNHIATIRFEGVTAVEGAPMAIFQLPYGVRPAIHASDARWILHLATNPATVWRGQINASGQVSVRSLPTSPLYGDISFPVPTSWPSAWA